MVMQTVPKLEPIVFSGTYLWAVPRPDRLYRRWRMQRERSSLGIAQIQDVLDDYGLTLRSANAASTTPGRSSSVVVDTSDGLKVLKRYLSSIGPETVTHEHSILEYLAHTNFPAPRLTPTKQGTTFVRRDHGIYALFDYLDGYIHYHNCLFIPSQTRTFIRASAKALAQLHLALKEFVPLGHNQDGFVSRDSDRWKQLSWFINSLDHFRDAAKHEVASKLNAHSAALLERADWIAARLFQLEHVIRVASPPRLIIHGDYGPYNILFKSGAPVVILDFERARLDWRLTDLSMSLVRFASRRIGFDFGKMIDFLAAYQTILPVNRAELHLLPKVWLYLTLRQLISCCTRYLASHDVTSLEKARNKLQLADWIEANERTLSRVLHAL